MIFIGDMHGDFKTYKYLLKKFKNEKTIQVGDMNIINELNLQENVFPENHKFIRGNHDNPEICQKHPNYLGDYGYLEEEDIFFVSGGKSINKDQLTPMVNWWEDEELSDKQFYECIELYKNKKPSIVVSHECPKSIKKWILGAKIDFKSKTEVALQIMLEHHRPNTWIFGHHHMALTINEEGTDFYCLDKIDNNPNLELGYIEI